jgi:hypothetical protein
VLVRQPLADGRQLGTRLEAVLGVGQQQLPRLIERRAVADADQHVLEPVPGGVRVVDFVGHHRWQAELVGQGHQPGDQPVVVGLEVVRQLDEEMTLGEVPGPAACGIERSVALAGQQAPRHLAVAAAGQAEQVATCLVERGLDQPALEDRELLLAGKVATRSQPRQGGVAVDVAGQQHEMVARHRSSVELAGPAPAGVLSAERVVQLAPAVGEAQLVVGAGNGDLEADDRPHR